MSYSIRRRFKDAETGKHYVFLTNNFKLAAKTIAGCLQSQMELFFCPFLKIIFFQVMTQIWIAMCVYLLIPEVQSSYKKYAAVIASLICLISVMMALLRGDPPDGIDANQMKLI